jgi:hypothetical protein
MSRLRSTLTLKNNVTDDKDSADANLVQRFDMLLKEFQTLGLSHEEQRVVLEKQRSLLLDLDRDRQRLQIELQERCAAMDGLQGGCLEHQFTFLVFLTDLGSPPHQRQIRNSLNSFQPSAFKWNLPRTAPGPRWCSSPGAMGTWSILMVKSPNLSPRSRLCRRNSKWVNLDWFGLNRRLTQC